MTHTKLRHATHNDLDAMIAIDRLCFAEAHPSLSEEQHETRSTKLRMELQKDMMLANKKGNGCLVVACNPANPTDVLGWSSLQHDRNDNSVTTREIRSIENGANAAKELNDYIEDICNDLQPTTRISKLMCGTTAEFQQFSVTKAPVVIKASSDQFVRVKPQLKIA